jgi:exonuclease III
VKVVTWNVNSLRSRLPRLLALLERESPDIVCLQETKVSDLDFPSLDLGQAGYQVVSHGLGGSAGVAIVSKQRAFGDLRPSRLVETHHDCKSMHCGEGSTLAVIDSDGGTGTRSRRETIDMSRRTNE